MKAQLLSVNFWLYLLAIGLMAVIVWWLVDNYELLSSEPDTDTREIVEERPEEPEVEPPEEEPEDEPEPLNQEYIGLDPESAGELAEENDLVARVVHQDGEDLPITMDFNPNRINLWVEDGQVFQALTDEEMTAN